MKTQKNKCRVIREKIFNALSNYIGPNADWLQQHIATCPKCQRRLTLTGRVSLALSVIKSQPHSIELLEKANTKAVNVLKHSLRYSYKAEELKHSMPQPGLSEKFMARKHTFINAAACLLVVFLMKTGVFYSLEKLETESQKAVKNYYAKNVGKDITNDIFTV